MPPKISAKASGKTAGRKKGDSAEVSAAIVHAI